MCFRHRVLYCHKVFVLYFLDPKQVFFIRIFHFQRRQGDAAAADHSFAGRLDHIAADRTDVEPLPEHIARPVFVPNILPGKQLNHRDIKGLCQRFQQGNVRQTLSGIT